MYTTGGLSTGVTESPPQAQQQAEPTLDTYVQPQDSVEGLSLAQTPHRSETQQKKVAESGSPYSTGTQQKDIAESGSCTQHRDSAEEGS